MRIIGESDSGTTTDLRVGETVEIRLPETGTTGYRWTVGSIDESVCELLADTAQPPGGSKPGAPGQHFWQLRGKAPGDCAVELASRRSTDKAPPARTFKVRLHVAA